MTPERILTVDLDGTLLRSDMLHESFWSAFSTRWQTPFKAAAALLQGRAALKRCLAEMSDVDVTTLPYDDAVLDYIRAHRDAGGKVALVTASDQVLADRIAAHLGVFDEVHGSAGDTNLKGVHKADFLVTRYGQGGFDYVGDSTADLKVWAKAAQAVTVTGSARLRAQAGTVCAKTHHLPTETPSIRQYLRALRPHQWLKNSLVLLPALAAHQLYPAVLFNVFLAFVTFSLVASAVYVLNDLFDLAADRAHPRKCKRPFASGAVPIAHGGALFVGLLGVGLGLCALLPAAYLLVMLIYLVLTTSYSLWLKRRIVIDISVLSGLYTMRLIAGGVATGIALSVWLLAFALFFFFSLAAIKRQAELVDGVRRGKLRADGRGYHVEDLPLVAGMSLAAGYLSVLIMALYLNSPAVTMLYDAPQFLWATCPVLLYWVSRMVLITHRGEMHDDPVVFVARDRVSQICFTLILALAWMGANL